MSLRVDAVLLAGVAAMLFSAGCSKPSYRDANAAEEGPTIAGRIVAPDGVLPPGAIVTARSVGDDRSGSGPIPTKADGRFLTPPLWPGTYVLRVQRTPPSTGPGSLMGLTIVPVKTEDVTGVTITLQRDVSLTGFPDGERQPCRPLAYPHPRPRPACRRRCNRARRQHRRRGVRRKVHAAQPHRTSGPSKRLFNGGRSLVVAVSGPPGWHGCDQCAD
jgi:hypothetical protein